MSQLAASDGQPGNWEEPDFSPRLLEPVRVQTYGWQEPCESRDSRTVLWGPGGVPCATRLNAFVSDSITPIYCIIRNSKSVENLPSIKFN